jgi:hypothetical protein
MNARIYLLIAAGLTAAALLGYVRVIRPWHLRWGATDEEVARSMPGDDIVLNPDFNATRAITINARPEQIWPWIVQMGFGRAGWYSYDWLDNLGRQSAEDVVPEFQHVQIGDRIPMSKWTYLTIKAFEPNQWMLWQDQGGGTWAWGLYPIDEQRTRLITRMRGPYNWKSPLVVPTLFLMEFGDIIMIRKVLRGIKRRAEQCFKNDT